MPVRAAENIDTRAISVFDRPSDLEAAQAVGQLSARPDSLDS